MGRKRVLVVERHISVENITKRIKEEKHRARIIPRLTFIRLLYRGKSVIEAAEDAGIAKRAGYQWLKRWNESGYEGLIPRFAGGKPPKLTVEQMELLKAKLKAKDLWHPRDVTDLIGREFGTEYSERQVRRFLKNISMKNAKPYQVDYRKLKDAEEKPKKTRSYKS